MLGMYFMLYTLLNNSHFSLDPPSNPVEIGLMMFHLPGEDAEAESMRGWPAATDLGSARTIFCYSQTSTLKQSPMVLSSGRCRAADMMLSCFVCFSSREQLAEILIGLGDNFSESFFFKLYLQNSEKSFFFSLWEVPVFQRIQTELCPGNWLLWSWVLKHTSRWGHFVLLYASVTEKFSLSGLCDFNSDDIWGRCQSINTSGTIFSFWISLWYILLYEPVSLGSKLHSSIEGPHWTKNHFWCSSKILLMKNMWEWTA